MLNKLKSKNLKILLIVFALITINILLLKFALRDILFRPEDLYNLRLKQSLDISKKGISREVDFNIKYKGEYDLGILLENFNVHGDLRDKKFVLELILKVDFYVNNELILTKESTGDYYSFLGKQGNGIALFSFYSPKELPKRKDIKCVIEVKTPDKKLSDTLGPAFVYIQKMSEL